MRHLGRRRGPGRGFTLIEIILVVAILGIVAALIVPHLLDGLQKAKQKRTLADLRSVGTAWFSWMTDQVSASAAGSSQQDVDFSELDEPLDAESLLELLNDGGVIYISDIPSNDSWGWSFDYAWAGNVTNVPVLGLRSLGRDGEEGPTTNPYPLGGFNSTDYDEDMVWIDGNFIRFPRGAKID